MAALCRRSADEARRILAERVDVVRAQVPAIRRESPDGIHDLRVASRRLVAAVGLVKRVAPSAPWQPLRQQARQITRLLGRVRELDVMLLQAGAFQFPKDPGLAWAQSRAVGLLAVRRAEAGDDVHAAADVVESEHFALAVDAVLDALAPGRVCHLKLARKLPLRAFQRARAAHLQWCDSGRDADLHAVRVALKKFRYTCELFVPVYDTELSGLLDSLKNLQDALGHWNDCRMLRLELRAIAKTGDLDTRTALQALAREVRRDGKGSRKRFAKAAEKFFGRANRRRIRHLLDRPAVDCCRSEVAATEA